MTDLDKLKKRLSLLGNSSDFELKGDNLREDDLFNLLNDNDEPLEINGIKVDINPIIVEKSGTLKEFMKRSNEYDKEHTI